MPSFLDLPAYVIEQIAKVRAGDEPNAFGYRKSFCFWALRSVGHRGVHTAAFRARHAVVRPDLDSAAALGDVVWCRVLLAQSEHREVRKDRALHIAAVLGHLAVAVLLVEHGTHVPTGRVATILQQTCVNGHIATARFLLENGADMHAWGNGPLRGAIFGGHANVVALLLEHGADPLARYEERENAIEFAQSRRRPDIVAMLRAHVEASMHSMRN